MIAVLNKQIAEAIILDIDHTNGVVYATLVDDSLNKIGAYSWNTGRLEKYAGDTVFINLETGRVAEVSLKTLVSPVRTNTVQIINLFKKF